MAITGRSVTSSADLRHGAVCVTAVRSFAKRWHMVPIAVVVIGAAAVVPTAWGNDRPFQVARTAVFEDNEHVWSFESWVQRLGSARGLSVEPEYTFEAGTSVQVELTRSVDRRGVDTGHEAEVEFKHIFNDVARDGWGWGLSAALSVERRHDTGSTIPSFGLKLPLSIALGALGADGGYLHLNVGLTKARDARRFWTGAAAIERELLERTVFFGELAREGGSTYQQVGARHWLQRDKLAIDFSLQQQRADGRRASGLIIGLGWYDF